MGVLQVLNVHSKFHMNILHFEFENFTASLLNFVWSILHIILQDFSFLRICPGVALFAWPTPWMQLTQTSCRMGEVIKSHPTKLTTPIHPGQAWFHSTRSAQVTTGLDSLITTHGTCLQAWGEVRSGCTGNHGNEAFFAPIQFFSCICSFVK